MPVSRGSVAKEQGEPALDEMFPFRSIRKMDTLPPLQPGQLIARGTARHLRQHNFVCLEEFVPTSGLRVDLLALGPKSEIWVVECKSSRTDFMSDSKWQGYLEWCDRFFWAVQPDFPIDLLPKDTGLIIADAYDAEIVRAAHEHKLPTARRKKLLLKFARNSADRLRGFVDPKPSRLFGA